MPGTEVIAWVLMAFAAAAIFWFIAGALRNRSRAERELNRLEPLLQRLGSERSGAWVAPGTLRITLNRGRSAIAKAVVVLLLQPRELGVLWLINRWQGRGDILIIRCDLRREPSHWTELFRDTSTIGKQVRSALDTSGMPLEPERSLPNGLIALSERGGAALVDRIWELWAARFPYVLRVAARPKAPHLVIGVQLDDRVDWPAIADAVTETAELVVRDFARR